MSEKSPTSMPSQHSISRRNGYLLATLLLLITSYGLQNCHWEGSPTFHTLLEAVATVLAFMVGILALIRYYNQEDSQFLYLGSGFLGTAFLDAYHAIVTSVFFQPYMPSDYPNLVPWSWIASRLFLSGMLFVSWWVWHRDSRNAHYQPQKSLVFSITTAATLACFLGFALLPLPTVSRPDWLIPRPYDFVPAVFFLLALVGYWRKGHWRDNDFEHWLILALIVSLATQTTFMPFSSHLNDTIFNVSHLLKQLSYILVMVGLLINLNQNYKALKTETELRIGAEKQIRESEQRFKDLTFTLADWVWEVDADGRYTYVSEAIERCLGYAPAEIFGKTPFDLMPLDEADRCRDIFQQIVVTAKPFYDLENVNVHKDGTFRYLSTSAVPILSAQGQLLGYRGTDKDITDRKLAETRLADEKNRLRLVLNSTAEAIFALDANNKCLFVNQSCLDQLGYERENQLIGQHIHQLFHYSYPNGTPYAETDCPLNLAALNGQVLHVELDYFWRKDGSCFPVEYWSRPYTRMDGSQGAMVTFIDITARQAQERQLRLTDQALRHANAATYLTNLDARLVDVNAAACQLLGYERDELLALTVFDFDAEITLAVWQEHIQSLKQTGTLRMETSLLSKQGSRIPVEMSVSYFESYGETFILGLAMDISERKRAEWVTKQYQAIVESSEDAIIAKNLDGIITSWNRGAEKIFGYSAAEMLGQPLTNLYPQELQGQEALILQRIRNGETVDHFEAQRICKNGQKIYVSATISPIYDATGQIIGASKIARDVTEQKKNEAELSAYRLNLEALVQSRTADISKLNERLLETQFAMESVGIGIEATDFETGKFVYVNRYACELLDYTQEELLQLSVPDIDPHFPLERYHEIKQTIRQQGQLKFESAQRTRTDQIIPVEISIFYQKAGLHATEKLIAFVTDISQRKTNENALKQAKEQAETAAQVKAQFLANMSHEIRTPMNAVLGFCSLLEQRSMDVESMQLVRKIHTAGRSLLGIINDILDFSKIEAGRLEIVHEPFDLAEMLDELSVLMNVYANRKNLELTINPPYGVDGLLGDRQRIQQVLVNLLGNAIKFTEQGEVVLRIDACTLNAQEALCFSVKDTGIGISAEKQVEIFSAFSQADTSIARRFGGTGLGLAISQHLVALMGGSLTVKSQLGVGSEFSFVLPLQRVAIDHGEPKRLANLKLLIADDSATARDALMYTAKNLGWQADTVESGEKALRKVLAHWEDQSPYDVVLLDWQMPGQDGLATAKTIQESFWQKHGGDIKIPIIIMVTAFDRDELMAQPGLAWVDRVLNKPLTTSSLLDAVTQILHERHLTPPAPLQTGTGNHLSKLAGLRILVVDDSELNLELAQLLLESNGAIVQCVADGQEALAWLAAHPTDVDLVLMDVQMPVMDGYTATRLIRQDARWQHLPVVALSAGVMKEERESALAAGMNDFIAKPLDADQLITTIQRLTGGQPQPSVSDKADDVAPSASTDIQNLPGIDVKFALNQWRDIGLYLRHLHKFISEYQTIGSTLTEMLVRHETDAAAKLLHKLKGVAGNLALKSVAEQAQALESLIKSGTTTLDTAVELQHAIDQACIEITVLDRTLQPADPNPPSTSTDASTIELLNQLLAALDQDNPAIAEPIIMQLQGRLAEQTLTEIRDQIEQYRFRVAEKMVSDAILAIQYRNSSIDN